MELLKNKIPECDWRTCDVMLRDFAGSTKGCKVRARLSIARTWSMHSSSRISIGRRASSPHTRFCCRTPSSCTVQTGTPCIFLCRKLSELEADFECKHVRRQLRWQRHLGLVELQIHFDGTTLDVTCSAGEATILLALVPCGMSIHELVRTTMQDQKRVAKGLRAWMQRGIVREDESKTYQINQVYTGPTAEEPLENEHDGCDTEEDAAEALVSSKIETTAVWPFVSTMLTNLGALSLERIHCMLATFAGEIRLDREGAKRLLQDLEREGLIVLDCNDHYQLGKRAGSGRDNQSTAGQN